MLNTETAEIVERRLAHDGEEAANFYASLPRGARVGMEATCPARWFERLLDRCGHELWVGDPASIRAAVVRKQKTDPRDARHLLELLCTDRFPRTGCPHRSSEIFGNCSCIATSWCAGGRSYAISCPPWRARRAFLPRTRFWTRAGQSQLEGLPLFGWAERRRQDLLRLLDQLDAQIQELTRYVQQEARHSPLPFILFSITYDSQILQPFCFENDTKWRGCMGSTTLHGHRLAQRRRRVAALRFLLPGLTAWCTGSGRRRRR